MYCGFYSTTGLALRERYVDAICQEMSTRPQTEGERIGTIYLGGGTPSQLSIAQLQKIFLYIYKVYTVADDAEVTIEVNPDDVTPELAAALQQLPINRVSMGAQTFNDERLHFLRRRHSSAQVHQAVATLRQAGFQNISIDLMYEEGTPLYRLLEQGKVAEIDEELERKMYFTLINSLESAGYEHYEISNFARPGYRSRHNSSYWKGIPYIGIGAAAHSFDIQTRSWNVADIQQYITAMEQGERCFEAETLDEDTRYNDAVTVALRTCEGLDLSTLTDQQRAYCLKNAQRHLEAGLLKLNDQKISLTKEGLFVSDMIMSDLMLV